MDVPIVAGTLSSCSMDEYQSLMILQRRVVVDLEYVEGAPDFVPNLSLFVGAKRIYNTGLYIIEMRSGHLESKKHNQEDNEFSDPYCEDSEYTVP
jgi:hypothetical protein